MASNDVPAAVKGKFLDELMAWMSNFTSTAHQNANSNSRMAAASGRTANAQTVAAASGATAQLVESVGGILNIVGALLWAPWNALTGFAYPLWASISRYVAIFLVIALLIFLYLYAIGKIHINWMPEWLKKVLDFFNVYNWTIVRLFNELLNPLSAKSDPSLISRPLRSGGRCDNVEWIGSGADDDKAGSEMCVNALKPQDIVLTPEFDPGEPIPVALAKASTGQNNTITWSIQGNNFVPSCGPYTDDQNGGCIKPSVPLTVYPVGYRRQGTETIVSLPT